MNRFRFVMLFAVLLLAAPGALADTAEERAVARELARALAKDTGETGSVLLSGPVPALASPQARITVSEIDFDPRSRRFTAMVAGGAEPAQVAGRFVATQRIPVLRQRASAGREIDKGDIQFIEVETNRLSGDIVDAAEDMVGMAAKRDLAPGQPIRARDLARPVMIAKGAMVTLVLQSRMMTLTAQGRAVEGGGRGDVIQVMNLQSKKSVFATVTGPNQAAVSMGTAPVITN